MNAKDYGVMFILSSPSGAGKTTLTKKIAEENSNFSISISHTTRTPRPNEIDGKDYHFVSQEKFDLLVFIQPTGPFITSKYINEGINMMMSGNYDSVFTATTKHWVPTWDKNIKPIEWDIYSRPRRQDRDEYYEETGMFYITSKERLLNTGIRYSGKIGIVRIPSYDSLQIDSREDLKLIEKIIS